MVTGAAIRDPRRAGEIAPPYMVVMVDEEPQPFGEDWTNGKLTATRLGVFWHLDMNGNTPRDEELCGIFNVSAPLRVAGVVPVEVEYPGGSESLAMPIDRARRLMRRVEIREYDFFLSDIAARQRRIQWDIELKKKMCMYWYNDGISVASLCGDDAVVETLNLYGTHMPACRYHISVLRGMAADLREESKR